MLLIKLPMKLLLSYYKYRILQIVRGRKLSWLQNQTLIRWKYTWLNGSLAWQVLLHRLFHWKSFVALIDPRKQQNFSTPNNFQYTVYICSIVLLYIANRSRWGMVLVD